MSLQHPISKAEALIEALPYLQAFRGKTFLIKMGGSAMEDPELVAQVMRDIVDYHATPEQAADAAKAAGVDTLVLNHLVPPQPLDYGYAAFLGDARKHFDGPIIVGEDGMLFSLQRGDDSIRRGRLF
jgi:ribonuclease Z